MATGYSMEDILACSNLPTLPHVAMKLLELIRDPDVSLDDIEEVVQSDQGLATRVLRTVNSSFYSLSTPCTSIKRALAYLGLNPVKSLALGFSLVDLTDDMSEDSMDFQAFWRRSIYGAAGARHFAQLFNACDEDETFSCAMFQDMGMLATVVVWPKEYAKAVRSAGDSHDRLIETEEDTFGFSHTTVGAALGEKWQLPETIVNCVAYHHAPDEAPEEQRDLVRVIMLGRLAAEALSVEDAAPHLARLYELAKQWFECEQEQIEALLPAIASDAHDLAKVLEQDVGATPDVQGILSQASDALMQHQLRMQQEFNNLQQQNRDMERQTVTDGLTGAWNRKKFDRDLANGFTNWQQNKEPFAVLFSDVDKFKAVNDTHGHQAGDAVLVELAQRMIEAVDSSGKVYRYGGEEFAMILPSHDADAAAAVAEQVRKAIEASPFDLRTVECDPDELPVTISIGVSATNEDHDRHSSAEQLTREADEAVYEAKQNGRNQVCTYKPPQRAGAAMAFADQPESQDDQSNAAGVSRSRVRILLIENDPLVAKLMKSMFASHGSASVVHAASGELALAFLEKVTERPEHQPDAILSDYQLNDLTGAEVAGRVRDMPAFNHLKTFVFTAKVTDAIRTACREAGVDEVFCKGDVCDDLPAWIDSFVQRCQQAVATAA